VTEGGIDFALSDSSILGRIVDVCIICRVQPSVF